MQCNIIDHFGKVTPGQSSVLKGFAGSISKLYRFPTVVFVHAYLTEACFFLFFGAICAIIVALGRMPVDLL